MNNDTEFGKKDKRLLVLLAFGALIIIPDINFTLMPDSQSAGFYWLELGGVNRSVYRATTSEQVASFSKTQGNNQALALVNGTYRATTDVGVKSNLAEPAPISPGLSFFLGRHLSINSATSEELALIPGIGPVLAGKIITHRQQYGPFNDKQMLLAVPGIGPRTASKITPYFSFK